MRTTETSLYYLHALSALHFGADQGIGVIDQPVSRESSTKLPQGPGSGIKGALRDQFFDETPERESLFGPKPGAKDHFKAALNLGDARLLCLPVRSFAGVFAWITSPLALARYADDLRAAGLAAPQGIPALERKGEALTHQQSCNLLGDRLFLEDFDLKQRQDNLHGEWAAVISRAIWSEEREAFTKRFAIVHDDLLGYLAEHALEIRTRIQLKPETRSVEHGPWYEEYLPAESILWGLLQVEGPFCKGNLKLADLIKHLPASGTRIQVGGNATIGAGQVRWVTAAREEMR